MWNNEWKKGEDYPAWGNTDVYKKTISGGYLFDGETPREAYIRVAKTVARRLYKPEMAETFFDYIWNGWLCLASPVLSNTGTDRGLPISCFGIDVADSIQDIGHVVELPQLISTLNMMTSRSGLKSGNLKEMLTDNHLTYISAQLLVINLCVSLNKEIRKLELDGVNYLESEKQLESRILCLKEMLTKQIQQHIKRMD